MDKQRVKNKELEEARILKAKRKKEYQEHCDEELKKELLSIS